METRQLKVKNLVRKARGREVLCSGREVLCSGTEGSFFNGLICMFRLNLAVATKSSHFSRVSG